MVSLRYLTLILCMAPLQAIEDIIRFERDLQLFGDTVMYQEAITTLAMLTQQVKTFHSPSTIVNMPNVVEQFITTANPLAKANILKLLTDKEIKSIRKTIQGFFAAVSAQFRKQIEHLPQYNSNERDSLRIAIISTYRQISDYPDVSNVVMPLLEAFEKYNSSIDVSKNAPLLQSSKIFDFFQAFEHALQKDEEIKKIDRNELIRWQEIYLTRYKIWADIADRIKLSSLATTSTQEVLDAMHVLEKVKKWAEQQKFNTTRLQQAIDSLILTLLQMLSQAPPDSVQELFNTFMRLLSLRKNPDSPAENSLWQAVSNFLVKALENMPLTDNGIETLGTESDPIQKYMNDEMNAGATKMKEAYEKAVQEVKARQEQKPV